jgi:predicted HTH domain antitoxin
LAKFDRIPSTRPHQSVTYWVTLSRWPGGGDAAAKGHTAAAIRNNPPNENRLLVRKAHRTRMKVILDIPEEAFSSLRKSPGDFAAELRLAAAMKWFEIGKVSQAKAAELAGLSRAEFIADMQRFGVSPIQLRPGELEAEIGA